MKFSTIAGLAAAAIPAVMAQTHNECNPLNATRNPSCVKYDCQYALGKSITWDFKNGKSEYIPSEPWFPPQYKSDGVHLVVKKRPGKDPNTGEDYKSDSPSIVTGHRILYGRLDAKLKIAPGQGIVSSLVLLSSTLDEIDWEWLGGKPLEAQSNYFGKGDTQQYNRGAVHKVSDASKNFHTYSIEWDAESIKWEVDGVVVRTVTRAQSKAHYVPDKNFNPDAVYPYADYYPQTPMQIKIGSWAGGDPSNLPGTIEWAGGETDFSQGPFEMVVDSVTITDFTTGAGRYCYTKKSTDGSYESIKIDRDTPFQPAPVPIDGSPVEEKKTTTKSTTKSTTTTTTKPSPTPSDDDEEDEEDDDPVGPHVTQGMPDSLGNVDGPQNKGVSGTDSTPSNTAVGAETSQTGEPSSASSVRTAGLGGLIFAMVAAFVLI